MTGVNKGWQSQIEAHVVKTAILHFTPFGVQPIILILLKIPVSLQLTQRQQPNKQPRLAPVTAQSGEVPQK